MRSLSESSTHTSQRTAAPCTLQRECGGCVGGGTEAFVTLCCIGWLVGKGGNTTAGAGDGLCSRPLGVRAPVSPAERGRHGELDAQHGAGDGVEVRLQVQVGEGGHAPRNLRARGRVAQQRANLRGLHVLHTPGTPMRASTQAAGLGRRKLPAAALWRLNDA